MGRKKSPTKSGVVERGNTKTYPKALPKTRGREGGKSTPPS